MPDGAAAGLLVAFVTLFAGVNGANDGAAMTIAAVKAPGLRPIGVIAALALAVGLVPRIVGTQVATTLRSGLVDLQQASTTVMVITGVTAGMVVASVLVRRGLPTSLTLAVVGGIVGAGLGLGGEPRWATVGGVLLIALLAPVVGGLIGRALIALPVRRTTRSLRPAHVAGTVVQAVAYAANDGQKMIAVALVVATAIATADSAETSVPALLLALIAAAFAVGTVVGLQSAMTSLGGGMLPHRPREEVVVQFSSAAAVLGSALLGAPVSMTQAIAGGQVGVGLHLGSRRVRWRVAGSLVVAWALTLPLACALAALAALVVRTVW